MRWRFLLSHGQAPLVWDSYFSTKSASHTSCTAKYPLDCLEYLDRDTRKRVFQEYMYAVCVQHYQEEEGMVFAMFQQPEVLTFFDLPPYATPSEIKTRFRELAQQYHPDKGGDAEKMIQLLEMYERCFPKKQRME